MERRQVRFIGRVQGVGFRATARAIARGYPVTGWVRNEADGTVLMEVQGEAGELEAFLEALRGEMGAMIAREESEASEVVDGEHLLEVRR